MRRIRNLIHFFFIALSLIGVVAGCSKKEAPKPPVVNPATITLLNKTSGKEGDTIIVTGTGFSTKTGGNSFYFNDKKATIIAVTTTRITVIAPANAQSGSVYVISDNITALGPVFTFVTDPLPPVVTILSLSDNTGSYGSLVTIKGSGFSKTLTDDHVFFNGKEAIITAATETQITTSFPQGAATGNVSVSVNGITGVGPVFTYQDPPVITSLSVTTGPFNTEVTITGKNFNPDYTKDYVFFNKKSGLLLSASSTKIIADVPLGAGTGKVTLNINGVAVTGPVFTYKLSPVTMVTTLAGYGTPDFNSTYVWKYIQGIVYDGKGNCYVADTEGNFIFKVTDAGVVSYFTGDGKLHDKDGDLSSAEFAAPSQLVYDRDGNVLVSNQSSIRRISKAGNVTTLLRDHPYLSPVFMVTDAANNIYFSSEHDLYKMTPAGVVTLFAGSGHAEVRDGPAGSASFGGIAGLCMDKAGNIFAADQQCVRKITPDGAVTTFISNATIQAIPIVNGPIDYLSPMGMAIDAAENLYFAAGSIIFKATKTGKVSLLAGRNPAGSAGSPYGENGYAPLALFSKPLAITVDASGNNVYVTDPGDLHVRKITTTMQ